MLNSMRSWHAINLLIILAIFLESVVVRPLSTDGRTVSSVEAKRRAGMGACVRHEHDDAFLSLLVSLASPTGVRSSVRSPLVGKKAVNQLQSLTELTAPPTTVVSVPRFSSSFKQSALSVCCVVLFQGQFAPKAKHTKSQQHLSHSSSLSSLPIQILSPNSHPLLPLFLTLYSVGTDENNPSTPVAPSLLESSGGGNLLRSHTR